MKPKITLAIESSCDDTSLAIVRQDDKGFTVDKIVTYSQLTEHTKYGGVIPEIAYRIHEEKIIKLVDELGRETIKQVDNISVTAQPGLMGSLMIGLTTAYGLGDFLNKPVIEVNHIYGHIFSILLERDLSKVDLPIAVLTVSGGHNEIYIIEAKDNNIYNWNNLTLQDLEIKKIGETLDDAAGESFDKVARMLGGNYPGGPWIDKQSLLGNHNEEFVFPRIRLDEERKYDFSFSGMKSCAGQIMTKFEKNGTKPSEQDIYDICREFQEAVSDTLVRKIVNAVEEFDIKTIALVGGVSANDRLFEKLIHEYIYNTQGSKKQIKESKNSKIENISKITSSEEYIKQIEELSLDKKLQSNKYICRPTRKLYSTDNAAMIGVVGLMNK